MTDLFTSADLRRAFPWISSETINYRVQQGYQPVAHKSTGKGIPNMFTWPQVIHVGVIDRLASFGMLQYPDRISTHLSTRQFPKSSKDIGSIISPGAFDPDYYPDHSYNVFIRATLREYPPDYTRIYHVWIHPEFPPEAMLQNEVALGIINVRQIHNNAARKCGRAEIPPF